MTPEARAELIATVRSGCEQFVRFCAAIAMGGLIGMLVGLSTSPVVHDVLVAVLAAALAYVGLVRKDGETAVHSAGAASVFAFALATAIGVLAGLYLRVVNPIGGEALQTRQLQWERIGFTYDEARQLVAREYFETRQLKAASEHAERSDAGTDAESAEHEPPRAPPPPSNAPVAAFQPQLTASHAWAGLCATWRGVHVGEPFTFAQLDTARLTNSNLDALAGAYQRAYPRDARQLRIFLEDLCNDTDAGSPGGRNQPRAAPPQ